MKDLSPLAVAHVPSTLAEPFSRTRILAPELLAQIFFLCRDDPDAARAPCSKHPSWVIITHVCARWRSVALSHACLWNTPRFTYNPQWIRAFVSRSRGAPLDISLTSSTLSSTSTISSWLGPLLAQHAHHIRTLSLSGPPVPIHLLLTHLAGPGSRAPVLRNLHITASHTLFGDLPLTVPADLFGGHTPALEMLELRCTAVPAGFALVRCRSLKTLHVELPPVGLGERKGAPFVSGEDMVRALEGMNELERLKLVNCLPRIESGAEDDDGILERLRKIVKGGFLDKESKKALSIGLGGVLLQ